MSERRRRARKPFVQIISNANLIQVTYNTVFSSPLLQLEPTCYRTRPIIPLSRPTTASMKLLLRTETRTRRAELVIPCTTFG